MGFNSGFKVIMFDCLYIDPM